MKADKYFVVGIVLLAVGGSAAVVLNIQGFACLTELSRIQNNGELVPGSIGDLEARCSIITNSYVYSLFAAIAGATVLVAGFMKRRKAKNNAF
jgi:hypothetical protein